jgi:hypothetical protein
MIVKLVSSLLVIYFFVNLIECYQNHGQPQQQQLNQQEAQKQLNGHTGGNAENLHGNLNRDHVLEHLDGVINKPKEQMSVDEQNFYYFKLHDYDNNNMLDGLELVSAFAHSEGIFTIFK